MDNKLMFNLVANTFNLVKEKSDIVNTSQPNSIICGCIYFWIVYTRIQKSDDEFSKTVGISKMTLLKVYVAVCDVVFNNILKAFFAILLKNCDPKPIEGTPKYKSTLKKSKNLLYNPTHRMLIHEPFDQAKIRVTPQPSKRDKVTKVEDLPLEEVDNTQEWNVLLDQQYYSPTDVYMLHIKLVRKNDKEMYFDFTEYDKNNETTGIELLRSLLIKRFEHDYEPEEDEDEDAELRNHLLLKRKLSGDLQSPARWPTPPRSPLRKDAPVELPFKPEKDALDEMVKGVTQL